MLKRNISGLLKKCKKHLNRLEEKIKSLLEEAPKQATKDFLSEEEILEIEDSDSEDMDSDDEEENYDMEPIREFMEEYIGLVITGFTAYEDDIDDLENEVLGRTVTSISALDNIITMELSSLTGSVVGYLEIKPTLNGHFADKVDQDDEEQDDNLRYKIEFFGGNTLHYYDSENTGNIMYHEG
jgi:hypothetical protein